MTSFKGCMLRCFVLCTILIIYHTQRDENGLEQACTSGIYASFFYIYTPLIPHNFRMECSLCFVFCIIVPCICEGYKQRIGWLKSHRVHCSSKDLTAEAIQSQAAQLVYRRGNDQLLKNIFSFNFWIGQVHKDHSHPETKDGIKELRTNDKKYFQFYVFFVAPCSHLHHLTNGCQLKVYGSLTNGLVADNNTSSK